MREERGGEGAEERKEGGGRRDIMEINPSDVEIAEPERRDRGRRREEEKKERRGRRREERRESRGEEKMYVRVQHLKIVFYY